MKGAHSAQLRYQDENGNNQSRIDFLDGGDFNFIDATDGTSHLKINSSGNVGIGTTSPDAQLEVEGSGTGRIAISGTTGANLQFRPNTSYTAGGNFGIYTTGLTSGTYESTMTIKGYGSGVNDVMTIKGLGRVGINDTSPQGALHVTSDSTTVDALYLESNVDSSSAAPVATFHRHSASPADADYLGS